MDRSAAQTSTTDPTGYTLLGTDSSSSCEIWGKIDGGSESDPSITWSSTTTKIGSLICLRSTTGWPAIGSVLHSASSLSVSNGGTLRVPGLTVTTDNTFIVCYSGKPTTAGGVTSVDLPADFDTQQDLRISNSGTAGYVAVIWSKQQNAATSITLGTTTVNTNTDSTARSAVALSLIPNAASSVPKGRMLSLGAG